MDGILSGLFSRKRDAKRERDTSPDIDELLGYEGDVVDLPPSTSSDLQAENSPVASSPFSLNPRSHAMRLTKNDPTPDFASDRDSISDFGFAPVAGGNQSTGVREIPRPTGLPAAVIGAKISFKGELSGEEDLLIQGSVEGSIDLRGNHLVIGKQGVIRANISARMVTVDGSVEGDIVATEHISIKSESQVCGNLKAERVTLEDGAKFSGSIAMDMDAEKLDRTSGELTKTFPVNASASSISPSTSATSTIKPDQKDIDNKMPSDPGNY